MYNEFKPFFRKSFLTAATLALAAGSVCTYVVRADDTMKMSDKKMSADDSKMVMDQVDKMKKEAADPANAEKMKNSMARMMVMDKMAMMLAHDSDFKVASTDLMSDANFKKVHDEAKAMSEDPDQMKKIKEEITSDSKEMKSVIQHAMMMDMMMDKMADKSGDKSSMSDMGTKMMDKMK